MTGTGRSAGRAGLVPPLLAAASWLFLLVYFASWWLPKVGPEGQTPGVELFLASALLALVLSPAAVVVGLVFLVRGIHRRTAVAGIILGLPLTLFLLWGLVT